MDKQTEETRVNPLMPTWSPWYRVRVVKKDLLGNVTVEPAGPNSEGNNERHTYSKEDWEQLQEDR